MHLCRDCVGPEVDKVVEKSTEVEVLLLTQKCLSSKSRSMAKHFHLSKSRKVVKINST